MNQGIYGFPNTLATSGIISITDFDASGTYTIPSDAVEIEILLVGGGGGGGSGGRSSGTSTANRGGGGGGSGGGLVYQKIQVKDLAGRNNLIITIGAGGFGGLSRSTSLTINTSEPGAGGFAGANSIVTISNYPGFLLQAGAGGGGGAGLTAAAAGSGSAPARNFLIAAAPSAMEPGGFGSSTVEVQTGLTYSSFRSSGGAGGGSVTGTPGNTPLPGGSIKISRINTSTDPLSFNLLFSGITLSGFTALYGGQINGGSFGGKGDDGFSMHRSSAGSYLFGGFGGAGGGGATATGGGNGGDGYRGGGGGGGGGVYSSTVLGAGQLPSGAGGNGGNGFCRIIARR